MADGPVNRLDVRAEADFIAGHVPGSANVPVEALRTRLYELPPPGERLVILDVDAARLQHAAGLLARRYRVESQLLDAQQATETGPQRVWLWRPSPFLLEAMEAIEARGASPELALDLACGSGREAVWLAMRGMRVEAIDILPDAVAMARRLGERCGVSGRVQARCGDVKTMPVAGALYDLVTVFRFLHRPLLTRLRDMVRPGGYIVYETFHQRTADVGASPTSPEHLLQDGELPDAFAGFDIIIARDGIERDGRFFSQLLAAAPDYSA